MVVKSLSKNKQDYMIFVVKCIHTHNFFITYLLVFIFFTLILIHTALSTFFLPFLECILQGEQEALGYGPLPGRAQPSKNFPPFSLLQGRAFSYMKMPKDITSCFFKDHKNLWGITTPIAIKLSIIFFISFKVCEKYKKYMCGETRGQRGSGVWPIARPRAAQEKKNSLCRAGGKGLYLLKNTLKYH